MDYHVPLIADNMYHILSHATGSDDLFIEPNDYNSFLNRFDKYISPVADTFAYSLIPNHFHFQMQIKSYGQLFDLRMQYKDAGFVKGGNDLIDLEGPGSLLAFEGGWQPKFVMQQFSNMLNGYAKYFNRKYDRKGSLFIDYMRRIEIKSDSQYTGTLFYIHKNPVHHGCCKEISDWKWSSYNTILSQSPTKIQRDKVIEWFGSVEKFIEYHAQPIYLKNAVVLE